MIEIYTFTARYHVILLYTGYGYNYITYILWGKIIKKYKDARRNYNVGIL